VSLDYGVEAGESELQKCGLFLVPLVYRDQLTLDLSLLIPNRMPASRLLRMVLLRRCAGIRPFLLLPSLRVCEVAVNVFELHLLPVPLDFAVVELERRLESFENDAVELFLGRQS
jgi:hypothetical protein